MGIPPEIRRLIYKVILTRRHGSLWVSFSYGNFARGYGTLFRDHRLTVCDWVFGPNNNGVWVYQGRPTSILRVCKQAYEEAREVLYQENHFLTHNVRGFWQSFVNDPMFGIGGVNASLIRNATFGVPYLVKENCFPHVANFIDFVCNEMTGLKYLRLTVKEEIVSHSASWISSVFAQETRAILNATALVTKSHPHLKKAIWSAESGGRRYYDGSGYVLEYWVDLFEGGKSKLQTLNTKLDEQGNEMVTKDIILNCVEVRSTAWDDLEDRRAQDFALPDDAEFSERPEEAVEHIDAIRS